MGLVYLPIIYHGKSCKYTIHASFWNGISSYQPQLARWSYRISGCHPPYRAKPTFFPTKNLCRKKSRKRMRRCDKKCIATMAPSLESRQVNHGGRQRDIFPPGNFPPFQKLALRIGRYQLVISGDWRYLTLSKKTDPNDPQKMEGRKNRWVLRGGLMGVFFLFAAVKPWISHLQPTQVFQWFFSTHPSKRDPKRGPYYRGRFIWFLGFLDSSSFSVVLGYTGDYQLQYPVKCGL